ncbi:hypothetical protein Slin14017_G098110 [Septoria linicola]|nr:hypothetical protein Slin14017_G098110 [Septoria linicola]
MAPTVPLASSLLGLPFELREQILREVFVQRIPVRMPIIATRGVTCPAPRMPGMRDNDLYWDIDQATWRLQHHEGTTASEKQKAYLMPDDSNRLGIRLTSIAAIAQVNKSLREEVSSFLRLATIDVVAEVAKFDFSHVQAFLAGLPAARLQDFVVRDDGTSSCTIAIDLCRPPDGALGRSSANLNEWLTFLLSIDAARGGQPEVELASHYRISVSPFIERTSDTLSTQGLLQMLYNKHEHRQPGPDKLDLYKILHAWWARWRVESHLLDGSSWTRHASPDDLRLPSLTRSFVR